MKYKVLYTKEVVWARATPVAVSESNYKVVAEVPAKDLDGLFRAMNVVDGDELPCKLKVRSMSVGDIAVEVDTNTAWYCGPAGWSKVSIR